MTSIEVGIFGRIFRLRSSNPTQTLQIAAELDRQLNELKERYEINDFSKLLLLCALQQQEQILNCTSENTQLAKELDRLNLMVSKIIGE